MRRYIRRFKTQPTRTFGEAPAGRIRVVVPLPCQTKFVCVIVELVISKPVGHRHFLCLYTNLGRHSADFRQLSHTVGLASSGTCGITAGHYRPVIVAPLHRNEHRAAAKRAVILEQEGIPFAGRSVHDTALGDTVGRETAFTFIESRIKHSLLLIRAHQVLASVDDFATYASAGPVDVEYIIVSVAFVHVAALCVQVQLA